MGGGPPQNTDLDKLVRQIASKGPVKILPTTKRIRLLFDGAIIADTRSALLVWEHEYYPQLYLPLSAFTRAPGYDIRLSSGHSIHSDNGDTVGGLLELSVRRVHGESGGGLRTLTQMAIFAADLQGPAEHLRDHVKIVFSAIDQWLEEDTPIYVHPKDPFKRVDTLASMTPIRITIPAPVSILQQSSATGIDMTDILLAESHFSVNLYETSLPTRYYIPLTSLQTIHLRPSATTTECPYKGVAQYHDVVVNGHTFKDLVWWYRAPTAECIQVTGLRCFYNEKCDIWLKDERSGDWVKQERPRTHFT